MGFWKSAGKVAAYAAVGAVGVSALALTGAAIADMDDADRQRLLMEMRRRNMSKRADETYHVTRTTSRGLFPREVVRVEKRNRWGRTLEVVELDTKEVFGETTTTYRRRLY